MADKFNKSCLIGPLRVIVFVICILTMLGAFNLLWSYATLGNALGELYIPMVTSQPVDCIVDICTVITALLGAYGAYSGRPGPLKLFACCVAVITIFSSSRHAIKVLTTDWRRQTAEFEQRMRAYAREYQFDVRPGEATNKATKAWDLVQGRMLCCGLEDPEDWHRWGNNSGLPKSCCTSLFGLSLLGDCALDGPITFDDGCNELDDFAEDFSILLGISTIVSLLLALIAWWIAKTRESDHGPMVGSSKATGSRIGWVDMP